MQKNYRSVLFSKELFLLRSCLTLLSLFLITNCFAQQPAYFMLGEEKFRGIQIYDVIQDKELNYWFATNEGIYHFDYYNYEKIDCDKAKSDAVFSFTMNAEGVIYCHNLNNQIFEITEKKCRLFYELKNDEGRSDISLTIGDDGQLVIGAKKIIVLNKNGVPVARYDLNTHFPGSAFTTDSGGTLFHLSYSDSVLIYAKGKFIKQKLKFLSGEKAAISVLKFFRIAGLSYAIDMNTKTEYRFNQTNLELTELPANPAFSGNGSIRIYETGNEIWVAGSFTGVALFSDKELHSGNGFFYQDYFISDVFKDSEGNMLLSTFDEGVLVVPDLQIPDVISSFREDPVTSVYADPDLGLVFGSSRGNLLNYSGEKTDTLKNNGTHSIEAVFGHPESDLLVFANGRIRTYNKKTKASVIITELSLKDAAFISPDEFYLGSNSGIHRIKWDGESDFSFEPVKDMQIRVYSMEYNTVNKCLYASTASGLYVIDSAETAQKILWNNEDIFPSQLYYHAGKVYASTRKHGILVIEDGKVTGTIQPRVNGKIEIVEKLLIHNHTIFANSINGFYQFDMNGNLLKSIHSTYGFSSHRTIDFTFEGEKLWVCHSGGVQQIDLNYSEKTAQIPVIRFDGIFANDKTISPAVNANLGSDQRKIQFVFSSPSLRNRKTTYYHYKLTGYDTGWTINEYESNKIIYNALAPGNYTLEVKAENKGVFSKTIFYSFSIAQPFYTRWWFITACIAFFLALVYIVYRWQLNIQRKKSRQINELNASKLTAIQSQMNPHFIFNSLNSIQDLILKGDIEHSYSYITTFSNLVRRTLNYSDKDFIDFEQEIKLLELYLSLEKLRFKKGLNYEIKIQNVGDIMLPPLLVQPFIENALVHGLLHKEGEKNLLISFELKDALICTVEDNGIGREKAKAIKQRQRSEHESFSGKAIRKRFEILSTALEGDFGYVYEDLYDGNVPSGTRVTLTIPVKRKY